jgi:shikimate dehydrogenase
MHNAAAAALGLNLVYLPLPVHPDDLTTAVLALPALGFLGVNVTVPHKQAVMSTLAEIDPAAQLIGAVNTIRIERGQQGRGVKLVGFNTDGLGLLVDWRERGIEVDGRDCLVLGAGGSARAVVYALAAAGGRVALFARRPEQAQQLIADLVRSADFSRLPAEAGTTNIRGYGWEELAQVAAHATAPLIINTTPVGMTPQVDASPWPETLPLPAGSFVYDLVYNPAETKLMQQAQAAGCEAANGLGMLLHQGAEAFYLWTGQRPDTRVMAAALKRETHPENG